MWLWLILGATLLLAGCVGPHSTGSLWALQNAQIDTELFRTPDSVRADQAHAYEMGLATEVLASERARLDAALRQCPSAEREPLSLSTGDRVRDGVRMWIGDDRAHAGEVAQVALADWFVRRANATGSPTACAAARSALAGSAAASTRSAAIDTLGKATVKRSAVPPFDGDQQTAVSLYALGTADAVTAPVPLARYLAAVYGGVVSDGAGAVRPTVGAGVDQSTIDASVGLDRSAAGAAGVGGVAAAGDDARGEAAVGEAAGGEAAGDEAAQALVDRIAAAYPGVGAGCALAGRAGRSVRIFYAVPRSAWVDLNLRRSLEDMGHELVRFDFPGWPDDADADWRLRGKPRTNERLLHAFKQAGRVDLFFGYFYSSVVYPATIDQIRRSGVPTVNFSCNNVHQFDLVRDIAAHFDACVVPERSALPDFERVGARALRIQLAANPRIYRPYPEPRRYDVTFVGQRYADRAEYLDLLASNGVAVRAWGAGRAPSKRLDVAHARAALSLIEDERLDGVRRLVRQRFAGRGGGGGALGSGGSGRGEPRGIWRGERIEAASPAERTEQLGQADGAGRAVAQSNQPTVPAGQARAAQRSQIKGGDEGAKAAERSNGAEAAADGGPGMPLADRDTVGESRRAALDGPRAYGQPRLLQRDLIRTFSQSRLSLGFATAGDSHLSAERLRHLRLREFEAPMSGALYLTEDQPELAEYFEPGAELLTYTDRFDLLDKARYYLAHDEAAERIRRAGLRRARAEHTWQHRFAELFAALGLAAM